MFVHHKSEEQVSDPLGLELDSCELLCGCWEPLRHLSTPMVTL